MEERQKVAAEALPPDLTETEEELELRHLRGTATRFELDSSELRRLISDLDQVEAALVELDSERSLLEKIAERLLPAGRSGRRLLVSMINVVRMNLEEIVRLADAQRSADERQLLDLVDALVERLADIDVLHARLRAVEQHIPEIDDAR